MKSWANVPFGLRVQEELVAKCWNLVMLKFQTPLLCLLQLWHGAEIILSAVVHRISAILIHSGAKSSDFTRLNWLGICMSHDQTIKKQVEMGESYDAKILCWKQEVESRELSKKLLFEVIATQQMITIWSQLLQITQIGPTNVVCKSHKTAS